MKPSKGAVGAGGEGSLSISTMFDEGGGGGGLIERWACLIWGFRYQCEFLAELSRAQRSTMGKKIW